VPKETENIVQRVWNEYLKGLSFNQQQDLDETVRTNENFFIGKQWEGVEANGLPTPEFNFLKRVVLFTVASVVSDNIKLNASAFSTVVDAVTVDRMANIVNAEFERVTEQNKLGALVRELMRNAAVDGDGCLYTYWDPDIESGQAVKGAVCTEVIQNTDVFFGNANDRRVQKQPYIIIRSREMIDEVKARAKDNGVADWELITVDSNDKQENSENLTDDKVTVLLKLWRDKTTKTIHAVEMTKNAAVRPEWDMGLKLYPVTWLNWDYIQDNYHGQAMITGLIPNQIFINKLFAMSMISLMTTAYPKIIYDKTRVTKWDNRVGAAIAINGGDVNNVAKILDPAAISPQIAQFIQLALDITQSNLGATSVALGEGKAYNTSAIVALQKAAAAPSELTKQNLYQCIEDLGRIYLDFMREYYGIRTVYAPIPDDLAEAQAFAGVPDSMTPPQTLDFSSLKDAHFTMKLDVGASSYWSEIASMQTLDNLLTQNKLGLVDYLERVPNGYIIKQEELIKKLKGQQANPLVNGGAGMDSVEVAANGSPPPNPTNVGMQNFQEAVMQ
jgi:hypothetical protein